MHLLRRPYRVALALLAACTTASCGDGSSNDPPLIGDAFKGTIVVALAGTGSGTVDVEPDPIAYEIFDFNCGTADGTCSRTWDLDVKGVVELTFTAAADAGSVLSGWAGECAAGTDPTQATLLMDFEREYECTATFDLVAVACTNRLVIEDPFTTDAGWTTTVSTTTANVTQAVSAQATGGNPGGFRQMQHIFTGLGAIAVFHTYGAVTYDPRTQGAIDHLNYFEDQIVLNPPAPGAAVGTGFSVTQGGTRYSVVLRPPTNAFTNTTWETTAALDLTAADFPGVDFSAAGGPITFGFFRSNTNSGGGALTLTHGVDNFKVEICR